MSFRIHYHSDCSFFAGCENMLVNFLHSDELAACADLSFSYRYSPRYRQGLESRVEKDVPTFPLSLIEYNAVFGRPLHSLSGMLFKLAGLLLLFRLWFLLYNSYVMWRFLGTLGPVDILHVNNGGYPGAGSCMAAVFAARLRGVRRIVYVVNNVAVGYRRPSRWLDYPFDRLVARWVDRFVTGSSYAGSALARVMRLAPERMQCIHNGVRLRQPSECREEFAARLGLPRDRLLLGVVAVLEERKGHRVLLQAMRLLKQRLDAMPLLLVEGHGSELAGLREYVAQNGLGDDVRFLGDEDNVFNLLCAVDFVILPSIRDEDFPNVVIESMGLGKPVIASRLCGTPEQIDDMESGLLVPPGDAGALAEAILTLSRGQEIRQALGGRAREKFAHEFTSGSSVGRYIDLYNELLASG